MAVAYQLNLKVDGAKELQNKLIAIEEQISDFTSVFYLIADDFRRTEKKKFEAEGSYDGGRRWAALSPEYAERKKKKVGDKPILVYSGALKQSLINKGDPEHILEVEPQWMKMGTRKGVNGWNLARLHQYGTKRMPERSVIELTDTTVKRWTDLMLRGIRQTLRGGLEKYKRYIPRGERE